AGVMCDAIGPGSFMTFRIVANAPAERIAFIEEQGGFGIDECGAGNGRGDFSRSAVEPAKAASECAAKDAFLNAGFIFFEFFVGRKAGKFGAGAGAARRTIEGFAGALDKIAGMRAGDCGRAEKFDVIDFRKALIVDGFTNAPAKVGKLFSVGERQIVAVS